MPLTAKELMAGLKDIAKFGAAAASGSLLAAGTVAVSITLELKEYVDAEVKRYLDEVRTKEGCRHITAIDGMGPPVADMLNFLARRDGMAWRTSRSAAVYFYHPQSDWVPTDFTEFYRKDPPGAGLIRTFTSAPSGPVTVCKQCKEEASIRNARAGGNH